MATGNFHATFDPKVYIDYQTLVGKGNVAKSLEMYMMTCLAIKNKETEGVDLKILALEIEKIQQKIAKNQAELMKKQEIREKIEEKLRKIQEKKLLLEKEMVEKANKCCNCLNLIPENAPGHEFPKGRVCKACFLGASSEDIRRWNVAEVLE